MVVSRVIVWKGLVLMIHVEQQVRSLEDGNLDERGFYTTKYTYIKLTQTSFLTLDYPMSFKRHSSSILLDSRFYSELISSELQ